MSRVSGFSRLKGLCVLLLAAPGLSAADPVDFNRQVKSFVGYGKGTGIYHTPVNPQARFSNLLLTMAQKMGVEAASFSDSSGAISEVVA